MKTTFSESMRLGVLLAIALVAPAAADPKPVGTCSAMCQRFTDCKLGSYTQMCLDSCKQSGYESTAQGRSQLAAAARSSCQQIQSSVGGIDQRRTPHSSRRGSAPAPYTGSGNDAADLDQLERELADLDRQLDSDEQELERRSRGAGGPARGKAAPANSPRDAGGSARRPAPSGSARWTCTAQGQSVYGFDVATGRGDVRGRSTVSIPGSGSSKDQAARAAMSSCGSLMTTNLSRDRAMVVEGSDEGQWGVRIETPCHVTRCAPM